MSEKSISKMLFSNQEKVELALVDDFISEVNEAAQKIRFSNR